jgi:hypothetical protein
MLPRYTLFLYSGRKRSPNSAAGGSSTSDVRGIALKAVGLPGRGMVDVMPGIEARLALVIF